MNQIYRYCYVCGEYTDCIEENLLSLISKHQQLPVHTLLSQVLTLQNDNTIQDYVVEDLPVSAAICLECYEQIDLYDYGVWIAKKTETELKRVYKEKIDKKLSTKDILNPYNEENNAKEYLEQTKSDAKKAETVIITEENALSIDYLNINDTNEAYLDNNCLETELKIEPKLKEKKPRNTYYKKRTLTDLDCKFCALRFSSENEVKQHLELHQGLHPLQCPICFKVYGKKDALIRHMCLHTGTHQYLCFVCGKTFIHYGSYDSHKSIHDTLNAKKYECKTCGKIFIHHGSYRTHKLSHENRKEKICYFCNKTFLRTSHLKRHIRTHTQEKLYECPCGLKFAEKYNLTAHQRLVHVEKQQKQNKTN